VLLSTLFLDTCYLVALNGEQFWVGGIYDIQILARTKIKVANIDPIPSSHVPIHLLTSNILRAGFREI
jgi:hypothetical protein